MKGQDNLQNIAERSVPARVSIALDRYEKIWLWRQHTPVHPARIDYGGERGEIVKEGKGVPDKQLGLVLMACGWLATQRLLAIFIACSATSRPYKLVPLPLQLFCFKTRVRGQFVVSPSPVTLVPLKASKVRDILNKNAISARWSTAKVSQTLYYDFIALSSLNIDAMQTDFSRFSYSPRIFCRILSQNQSLVRAQ